MTGIGCDVLVEKGHAQWSKRESGNLDEGGVHPAAKKMKLHGTELETSKYGA